MRATPVEFFQGSVREQRYASEAAARYGLRARCCARGGARRRRRSSTARARRAPPGPMVETLAARIRLALGDRAGAATLLGEAHARFPQSRPLLYAHSEALQEAGRNERGAGAAHRRAARVPRDPRLHQLQAKNYAALGKRLLQHQSQAEVYALQGSLPAAIEQLQIARTAGDGDFYQLSVVDARLKELRAQHAQELKDAKR